MPLFIPILVGAAVGALVGVGIKQGREGIVAMRRAKDIGEAAQARHAAAVAQVEKARSELQVALQAVYRERQRVARETLGKMVRLLEALERRGRVNTVADFQRLGIEPELVQAFIAQYIEGGGVLKGAIVAAGAGAGASAAASAAVTAFATAGTGAAISGLTGAAANSAMLAWLGGGSLAAGGGGMALGSLVLGGIAVGPAVAVAGFVVRGQGEKALTHATEYAARVDVEVSRIDLLVQFHGRAQHRANELITVTRAIDARADSVLNELLSQVEVFDQANDADVQRLSLAMLLCKALSELLRVTVIDEHGDIHSSSADLAARYQTLAGNL